MNVQIKFVPTAYNDHPRTMEATEQKKNNLLSPVLISMSFNVQMHQLSLNTTPFITRWAGKKKYNKLKEPCYEDILCCAFGWCLWKQSSLWWTASSIFDTYSSSKIESLEISDERVSAISSVILPSNDKQAEHWAYKPAHKSRLTLSAAHRIDPSLDG